MPRVEIALDARDVYRSQRRGTGKNLIDLYTHLARRRPEWRFLLLHQNAVKDDPFSDHPNVARRRIDIPGDRWNLWHEVRLPMAVRRAARVLHCPANTAPRWLPIPTVVTIHDLIPLDPRWATPAAERWGRDVARSARQARRILTPSEFTRQLIARTFGVSADKITVNHWVADSRCQRVDDPDALRAMREAFGLRDGRPYVFGFGGADPRKNTAAVIEAWAKLPPQRRRDYALVLVGIQGPSLARFTAQAEALGVAESCRLHGFADEKHIPALITGATVLCYPSLSEGFGLPVLDGFACETPVLTSTATSLPEVAGEAAVLVDPSDSKAIADGLEQLLADDALRDELVRRGRRRAGLFTWQACADRAAAVLESAME